MWVIACEEDASSSSFCRYSMLPLSQNLLLSDSGSYTYTALYQPKKSTSLRTNYTLFFARDMSPNIV